VIRTFLVSPSSIREGESAGLRWDVQNADMVSINGSDRDGLSGSLTVNPEETTTYILKATGASGSVLSNAVLTVMPGEPRYSLLVYADTLVPPGAKIQIADRRLRNLGFSVRYHGPEPRPLATIRVEWWVGGKLYSPFSFGPNDTSYSTPHRYDNKLSDPGRFEVKLLVNGQLWETHVFEVIGGRN